MNATSDRLSRWTLGISPRPWSISFLPAGVEATRGLARAQIKGKYTDGVEVCPVNCFYVGKTMLVIQALFMAGCDVHPGAGRVRRPVRPGGRPLR